MRRRELQKQIVGDRDPILLQPSLELCNVRRCGLGRLRQKARLLELQTAGWVNPPRSQQAICIGEPDVAALVVGEIEVVVAEPALDPVRGPDHRRTLNIHADAGMQIARNDGPVEKSLYLHPWLLYVRSVGAAFKHTSRLCKAYLAPVIRGLLDRVDQAVQFDCGRKIRLMAFAVTDRAGEQCVHLPDIEGLT